MACYSLSKYSKDISGRLSRPMARMQSKCSQSPTSTDPPAWLLTMFCINTPRSQQYDLSQSPPSRQQDTEPRRAHSRGTPQTMEMEPKLAKLIGTYWTKPV